MSDKIVNQGYVIEQELQIGEATIVLGVNPDLVDKKHTTPYVTWECDSRKENFYWGHYFKDKYTAQRDLVKRGSENARYFDRITGFHKQQTERDNR